MYSAVRYNAVNLLQNSHNRHPNEGEVWGVCCEFEVLFAFCCCHLSAVCDIMINWHSTVIRSIVKPRR